MDQHRHSIIIRRPPMALTKYRLHAHTVPCLYFICPLMLFSFCSSSCPSSFLLSRAACMSVVHHRIYVQSEDSCNQCCGECTWSLYGWTRTPDGNHMRPWEKALWYQKVSLYNRSVVMSTPCLVLHFAYWPMGISSVISSTCTHKESVLL